MEGCSLLKELSRNIDGDERTTIDDRAIIEELQFTEVIIASLGHCLALLYRSISFVDRDFSHLKLEMV